MKPFLSLELRRLGDIKYKIKKQIWKWVRKSSRLFLIRRGGPHQICFTVTYTKFSLDFFFLIQPKFSKTELVEN